MRYTCRAEAIWPAFPKHSLVTKRSIVTKHSLVTKHSAVKTPVLAACVSSLSAIHSTRTNVYALCRRLPVLPQDSAMSSEVLGLPAHIGMPEDQEQAAPLAEPDSGYGSEMGDAQQHSYDLWPPEPVYGPIGFDGDQTKQLYRQLHQHCQLLVEVYALTACNSSHQEAAVTIYDLFTEYQVDIAFLSVYNHILALLLSMQAVMQPSWCCCLQGLHGSLVECMLYSYWQFCWNTACSMYAIRQAFVPGS